MSELSSSSPSSSSSSSPSSSSAVMDSLPTIASNSSSKPAIGQLDEKTAELITQQMQANFLIKDEEGQTKTLTEEMGLEAKHTLFFKNCRSSTFSIDTRVTKILIEGCNDCKFMINASIYTESLEIWRCNDVSLQINSKIKTLQVDLSEKLEITFTDSELFDQLVWAKLKSLKLRVGEKSLSSGVDQVKQIYPDFNEDVDQFIIRFIRNKLVEEMIIRLDNGFPSTEREAQEFDERKARNDAAYEAYVKKLLSKRGHKLDSELGKLAKDAVKVGRNDPCPCASKKKYKACCGSGKK